MPNDNDKQDIAQFEIPEDEFAAAVSPPDCKGRINLRCEQMLQQEIEDIAEDSRYPLRSVSEVVRFCCLLGLQRLRQWKPAPTLLGSIRSASALVMRDRMQCEAIDLMSRLEERVNWYIVNRHFDEVVDLVAKVRSYFDGLPSDFWSEYLSREIDSKFAKWLDRIDAERSRK
mgnify:CR=1 FL=1